MAEANVRLRVDGRDAVNQLNRVNKAAGTLQGTVGKLVGAFAGIQAAKFVFFKTAELETQTRSLKVLTGSLGNAQKIIKELQQFGAVTPFTSAELIETAKRLKAFGFETEKIVDVTKRLGDIAGATGADLGGIATAFGQIQAKGRLQGEELLQLQERGVDLQGTLRKEYGLTAEEFQKALSQGRIGADVVNFALEKLTETGGKYAGGAIAQSDTLAGKFSTLVDGVENIARSVGEVLEPAIKGVLGIAIDTVNSINAAFNAQKRLSGFGISDEERNRLFRQADAEAQQIAKIRGGGFINSAEFTRIRAQRFSDLINQFGFETGQLIPEISARTGTQARPGLGGGTRGGAGGAAKGRVDASKELVALNEKLFASAKPLSELERISLAFQIEKQQILDQDLGANAERIQLLQAAAGFERNLISYRQEQLELQQKQIDTRMKDFSDQLAYQEELSQMLQKENLMFAQIGQTIQDGLVRGIEDAVTGAKSLSESLSGILKSVGSMLLRQGISSLIGSIGGGGGTPEVLTSGIKFFGSEGGYASGATNAVIGEAGPEYLIPESKMRESMARYSRGVRGSAVIPENGEGGTTGEGGGTAVATQLDVRFNVERINNVDYVTAEEFQAGMQKAASQGAQRGQQLALSRLQQSPNTRRRLGL